MPKHTWNPGDLLSRLWYQQRRPLWIPVGLQRPGLDGVVGCMCPRDLRSRPVGSYGGLGKIRTHDLFHAMADITITCDGPSFRRVFPWNPHRLGRSGTPRASRTRAVAPAPPSCPLRFVKQETTTRVFPIHAKRRRRQFSGQCRTRP